MRILLSAYACEPHRGSEPGVGWNLSRALAGLHEVTVITRSNNRTSIEAAEAEEGSSGVRWLYYDLPRWARWWKRGGRGVQLYYYLWQIGAGRLARAHSRNEHFDIVHHITFVKFWTPSFMTRCAPVFIWGPVGGGEQTPRPFIAHYSLRGQLYEALRDLARGIAMLDPWLRRTARDSAMALVTTEATGSRVRALGARRVRQLWESGLTDQEYESLGVREPAEHPLRFISSGRLMHLKGFEFGLRAFARAALPDAEFWIVGDGAEMGRLVTLARELGISEKVTFKGSVHRSEALQLLKQCDVLVHPSLHDSGGWVCVEAMAAGLPVICLDVGGPATQVTADAGYVITVVSVDAAVEGMALAMSELTSVEVKRRLSGGARERARVFLWTERVSHLDALYRSAAEGTSA